MVKSVLEAIKLYLSSIVLRIYDGSSYGSGMTMAAKNGSNTQERLGVNSF
jgi:hypothetical protein